MNDGRIVTFSLKINYSSLLGCLNGAHLVCDVNKPFGVYQLNGRLYPFHRVKLLAPVLASWMVIFSNISTRRVSFILILM